MRSQKGRLSSAVVETVPGQTLLISSFVFISDDDEGSPASVFPFDFASAGVGGEVGDGRQAANSRTKREMKNLESE